MKTYRQVVQILGFACILMVGSGCASYHVTSDPSLRGELGYKVIDTTIKRSSFGWSGPVTSQIGANENGFTVIEVTLSIPISGPNYTGTRYYGRSETHRWTDIEDVTVRAAFGGILLCGIVDPTLESCVRLKLKDGTTKDISAFQFPMRLTPIWLVTPEWRRAHKAGKAFQSIVDALNQEPTKHDSK